MDKKISIKQIALITASQYQLLQDQEKKNCKDEFIIKLGYKEFKSGDGMINNLPCYECAVCGKKMYSIEDEKDSIVIDATEYKSDINLNNENEYKLKLAEVKSVLLDEMIQQEGFSTQSLAETVKDDLLSLKSEERLYRL